MSRPLPRYLEPDPFEPKLARILLEVGEPAPTVATVARATLAGDERRLRGIPVVGRGISGGVDPYIAVAHLRTVR